MHKQFFSSHDTSVHSFSLQMHVFFFSLNGSGMVQTAKVTTERSTINVIFIFKMFTLFLMLKNYGDLSSIAHSQSEF